MPRKITTTKTRAKASAAAPVIPAVTKAAVAPQAAKPVTTKAAKPVKARDNSAAQARSELLATERDRVAKFYNGPSLAIHNSRNPKLADCVARIRKPVQRAETPSTRDESLLIAIRAHADKSGAFDPSAFGCDLGIISRLASLGFLTVNASGSPCLTKTGTERAANVATRAAKPVKA